MEQAEAIEQKACWKASGRVAPYGWRTHSFCDRIPTGQEASKKKKKKARKKSGEKRPTDFSIFFF
jgi:hypothetical protein